MVVIANATFGWIKAGQKTGFGGRYFSVDFSPGQHARIAEAYGVRSWRVEEPAELKPALAAALEAGRADARRRRHPAAARGARPGLGMGRLTMPARLAQGGKAVYGAALGILMLEARFPRIPGDVGHAGTWPFPVLYKVVPGASPERVVRRRAEGLLEAFIAGARELVALGADGITTNCGFLSLFQRELAAASRCRSRPRRCCRRR